MAKSSLIFLSFLLLFISSATSFNITKLLGTFPDFSTYNDYLTQTHLNSEINSRQTITVLAVSNDAMSSLSGKPSDLIKKVMSLHVVLDYYDPDKLHKLSKKTAILTTLFQSSGMAVDQQGFLNVTLLTTGDIAFGSAVKGSALSSKLVKSVAAQPYNISVLQVSGLVFPSGIENSNSSSHSNSSAPAHPPRSAAPKKSPAPSSADSPKSAAAPSEAEAPAADAPAADAPVADAPAEGKAPVSSPPKPAADGPVADGPADAPDQEKSSAKRVTLATSAAVALVLVSSWFAL